MYKVDTREMPSNSGLMHAFSIAAKMGDLLSINLLKDQLDCLNVQNFNLHFVVSSKFKIRSGDTF